MVDCSGLQVSASVLLPRFRICKEKTGSVDGRCILGGHPLPEARGFGLPSEW